MSVHLTRIYTRVGDDGTTALGDFSRVPKTSPRLAAYADVDETNAAIGVAIALGQLPEALSGLLRKIQNDLFDVGSDLATPAGAGTEGRQALRITPQQIAWLEQMIDLYNDGLAPLTSFVLPGGTTLAASLHVARTVVRRAERQVVALREAEPETSADAMIYLNRLSDLLFVLARVANGNGKNDVLWEPGRFGMNK